MVLAKALGEDVVNHTLNKYSLPYFAEFVKTFRRNCLQWT